MTRLVNHNPPPVQIPPGCVTILEAAKMYGVSRRTVWKWIDNNMLPACAIPLSRRIVINRKTLERFAKLRGWKLKTERNEWRLDE